MGKTLTSIGLTSEEISLYLSLLEKTPQSAIDISKTTTIKRTYVYQIAKSLIDKGLVSEGKLGRTTVYSPNSPDHLLTLAAEKKSQAEIAEKNIETILNSLKAKYSSVEEKPTITYFEGLNGLKKIYLDTIKENQTIYAFLQNKDIDENLRQWLRETYLPTRVKENIKAQVILASHEKTNFYPTEDEQNLRQTKIIPAKNYPFELEVNIYGPKVAFINFNPKHPPVGFIIENKAVAQTMKALFEFIWQTTT